MKRTFPFTTWYILLLLIAVLASWLVGLYGVDSVNNLLSSEGVRWWMRSVLPAFTASPVGEILLVLFTLGTIKSVSHPSNKSTNKKAWVVALLAFAVLASIVLWGILSGNLLSVTGHWAHSPLQAGWLPVLALLVGIPCLCFGLANGTLTGSTQVLEAVSCEVTRCAPAFVTLFIASQLTAVLDYSRLPAANGIESSTYRAIVFAIYWLPFIVAYLRKTKI